MILANLPRKRSLEAFFGVDTKNFYEIVFLRSAKSRLLVKEASEIDEICAKFEEKFQTKIKKRVIFYNSTNLLKVPKLLQRTRLELL